MHTTCFYNVLFIPLCSSFPDASDGNYPDSQSRLSVSDDDLKQQEEEFRWKNEIEEEERMLEESLEYQRRIENEAKQKHLAEQQHKKSNLTFPEKLSGGLHDYFFDPAAADSREPLVSISLRFIHSRYCKGIENQY